MTSQFSYPQLASTTSIGATTPSIPIVRIVLVGLVVKGAPTDTAPTAVHTNKLKFFSGIGIFRPLSSIAII
jgi:hypothetical protein